MIPEIAHFSLILALCLSLIQGLLPIAGTIKGRREWILLARPAAQASFMLMLIAFASLAWCFYSNDFSLLYVVEHSNSALPTMYRIGAVWGGHEGSLLLWILLLTLWTFAVTQFSRSLDEATVANVIGVLGLVTSGLLIFVLMTSNPFERAFPIPENGRDLNPLLQDPGLVFHPPMLYMGYVGFSVAFAFAVGSLISGKLDAAWARWSRPWTTTAWIFLTLGIALGSRWAYYVLGWGGWWFWDPVENASFMPWIVGTALLHSLAVTEKRGSFKNWTVLLAIFAFSLSLLGTFLVRSGVLTSVHAFATDPRRGIFILVLLTLVVGSSLMLYAWRAPRSTLGAKFELMSRETLILIGNVCLLVAAASVLLGTIYPLIIDALNLGKLSVGPPYFNSVFVPLMVPVVLLMGVTPWSRWKHTAVAEFVARCWKMALVASAAAVFFPLWMGHWSTLAALGYFLVFWVLTSGTLQIIKQRQSGRGTNSFWAMQIAHAGIAVFIFGVTMVNTYQEERDVRIAPGEHVSVSTYDISMLGISTVNGPNYEAVRGQFVLSEHAKEISRLAPEKRTYASSPMPMTEAAIDVGLTRDIYISLGEPLPGGQAWAARVYYKPFVNWIWAGCFLMALGGLFAVTDKRYRARVASRVKFSGVSA